MCLYWQLWCIIGTGSLIVFHQIMVIYDHNKLYLCPLINFTKKTLRSYDLFIFRVGLDLFPGLPKCDCKQKVAGLDKQLFLPLPLWGQEKSISPKIKIAITSYCNICSTNILCSMSFLIQAPFLFVFPPRRVWKNHLSPYAKKLRYLLFCNMGATHSFCFISFLIGATFCLLFSPTRVGEKVSTP